MEIKVEDAMLFIIDWLRRDSPNTHSTSYGYDIYIPNVIGDYLQQAGSSHRKADDQLKVNLSPAFYAAAWELCRRGIIRPGVRIMGAQGTIDGSGGNGYSVTPFGHQWIEESEQDTFVPTEPGRFAEMLEPFRDLFGLGFYIRAQEAIRCYGAHAYLACCAMCGAAAESILLATAIARTGDEQKVLKAYSSSRGRSRVENMVIGQANKYLKTQFQGNNELLKYWRDEASHGKASTISDNEAYTSLAMLLRYAMFVKDNWENLTGSSA
jgi:hypothetical protein